MTRRRPQPQPDRSGAPDRHPGSDPHRLRVRRPADFLAVIPYLLGFHPQESLVVVLSRRGRVVLTARLDLPSTAEEPVVAAQLRQLSGQHEIDEVVLVAYGDDEAATRSTLERVRSGLEDSVRARSGLEDSARVREVLLVSRARWWSLSCTTGCCPPGGAVFDPGTHPLAAEAVYRGLVAGPTRASVEEVVAGPVTEALPRLRTLVARTRDQLDGLGRRDAAEAMADTVRVGLAAADGPGEAEAVQLAVLALDLAVRDVAWALMNRPQAEEHQRLWARVVASTPPELASAPCALLGAAAWIGGNGALLNCCVERLEREDPGYTLGHLLADLSERAMPPSVWDELAGELRAEVGAVTGVRCLH